MLTLVLNKIDQANLADPNRVEHEGKQQPKEYVYSLHMTRWLFVMDETPSELMQIACRAQHLERWRIPRDTYPLGKKGYYQWRTACNEMHGQRAAELMAESGYSAEHCNQVSTIISKRELRHDANTQQLEDVACLVFLEKYFAEFYQQNPSYDGEKWQRIVSRTWAKMSESAQAKALELAQQLPEHLQQLLSASIKED